MSQGNTGAMTLPEKVVEHIGYSSAALEKAAAYMRADEARKQKIASLIPAAVDALVAGERITEAQREKAAEALCDPVKALEILTKTALHRNADERALGQPVGGQTKAASAQYNSLQDPHVGARSTRVKQSSVALFTKLGLAPPAEG